MSTIVALIIFLISHRVSALRLPLDVPIQTNSVSNTNELSQLLLEMAYPHKFPRKLTGEAVELVNGKSTGEASMFMAGVGKTPTLVVDTRELDPYPYQGAPGAVATNPGKGQEWKGWRTKNCLFRKGLEKLNATDPEQIAVLTDGGDVIFGGCNENQLLEAYRKIVAASDGAPIVLGAELGLFPNHSEERQKEYDALEPRRRNVLREMGFAEDLYADHASCTHGVGPCSDPPRYKYANGGFRMGPVRDLLVSQTTMCNYKGDEQDYITQLMLKNPKTYTLDYTGSLVMNLHQFKQGALQRDAKADEDLVISNNVLKQSQCFIHGNGKDGKQILKQLLR